MGHGVVVVALGTVCWVWQRSDKRGAGPKPLDVTGVLVAWYPLQVKLTKDLDGITVFIPDGPPADCP